MKVSSLGWVGWGRVEVLITLAVPLNCPWQVLITQTRYCEDAIIDRGAFQLSLAEHSTTQTERLDIARMTAVPLNYPWQRGTSWTLHTVI